LAFCHLPRGHGVTIISLGYSRNEAMRLFGPQIKMHALELCAVRKHLFNCSESERLQAVKWRGRLFRKVAVVDPIDYGPVLLRRPF
jgi:hypothetical protein